MIFSSRNLRKRLLLLIVAVALPVAIFDVYHTTRDVDGIKKDALKNLFHSSSSVADKVNGLIDSSQELLLALATADAVSAGDAGECSGFLGAIGKKYSKYTNFSVVDRDKYLYCSSGKLEKPVHLANSPNINEAFATGKFAISPFKFGVLTGKPILVFSLPLLDGDGNVTGTINNGLSLDWLGDYLASLAHSNNESENIVVFDGRGIVLAAYPENIHTPGREINTPALLQLVLSGDTGETFSDENGNEMLVDFARIYRVPGGAFVASYIPVASLYDKNLLPMYQHGAIMFLLIAASFLIGWWGLRRVLIRPIDSLISATEKMANGDLTARANLPADGSELGKLGESFDQMAESVFRRTEAMLAARRELLETETKLEAIFKSSRITAIIAIDAANHIIMWSPGAENVFGFSEAEAMGRSLDMIIPEKHRARHHAGLQAASNGENYKIIDKTIEITALHRDGHEFDVEMSLGVWTVDGEKYFNAIINDISERKKNEKRINTLAYHDPFTGMPNEAHFLRELQRCTEENRTGFVAHIALARVGDIVGTFGLEASELIIFQTGMRLSGQVGEGSTVAHVGQRLFRIIYLMDDPTDEDIKNAARRIFDVVSEPFDLMGSSVPVNFYMGVCRIDPDKSTVQTLITDTEIALHEATRQPAGNIVHYTNPIKEQLVRNTRIVSLLHSAIDNDIFRMYFQPQVNLKTNQVVGCEALIRWPLSDEEWISPAEFIPVAERSGLITDITVWTTEQACKAAAGWLARHDRHIRVGVNISAEDLVSPDFIKYVNGFIAATGLPPELLEIEITETALMKDVDMAIKNLEDIHAMGATVAIDDFGTGQSSLAYLKMFPIDRLKIDQSFVKGAPTNATDRIIILSIVELAHSLGMSVIAEGAEEREHIDMLIGLGCDEVQGYHIAKPMPGDDFINFVNGYH